jgi:DNA gyrase subunit B
MHPRFEPSTLEDCQQHGPGSGAELFIVEGLSAAKAVVAVCNRASQAVLAMQGKPINAMKARVAEVDRYELFRAIVDGLGFESPAQVSVDRCRFEKIILLFDPDADGIHCGALLLIYIYRRLKPLLDAGRVSLAHAPLMRLDWLDAQGRPQQTLGYSPAHGRQLLETLSAQGINEVRKTFYRGLANIDHDTLRRACVDPESRRINGLRGEDAEAAIAMFGG